MATASPGSFAIVALNAASSASAGFCPACTASASISVARDVAAIAVEPSILIAARRDLARVMTVKNERAAGKGARA